MLFGGDSHEYALRGLKECPRIAGRATRDVPEDSARFVSRRSEAAMTEPDSTPTAAGGHTTAGNGQS